MKFTEQQKKELIQVIKNDYNKEELKDFIAKCIGETLLLTLSLNDSDSKNPERKILIEYLKELKEIALNRLEELNKNVI